MTPTAPRPAASTLLVRPAPPGAAEPFEVYVIRRHRGMKFLGGFYAFPGGKVEPEDRTPESLARCRGLTPDEADALLDRLAGGEPDPPALAYWLTALRELLEESGLLVACDEAGRPVDAGRPEVAARVERVRAGLGAGRASFAGLLAGEGWYPDLRPLRYLSHFVTPTSSPIRFSARFFLCPLPAGQAPRLLTTETAEGFWIGPAEGYRRFRRGEMAMAEPAEYGLAYLAQFDSLDELWAAHADGRHKFDGIIDRIDVFWPADRFDWAEARWRAGAEPPRADAEPPRPDAGPAGPHQPA